MADFEGFPIIWVSSSSESESSEEYATCAEDSIDLELLEDDEIAQLIRALDISEEEAQAGNGGANPSNEDATLYRVVSARGESTTADWVTAGNAQVAGSHVVALKERTKKRQRFPYYVVFIGRPTGLHTGWPSASAATTGISGNCVLRYATLTLARNALEYAEAQGWIGSRDGEAPHPRNLPVPLDPYGVVTPPLTPLCPTDRYRRYYCVYRGQRPGIYASHIEAHLSAIGVPSSLHERFYSITVARQKYLAVLRNDEIFIIPMP